MRVASDRWFRSSAAAESELTRSSAKPGACSSLAWAPRSLLVVRLRSARAGVGACSAKMQERGRLLMDASIPSTGDRGLPLR
jgi:hypothetical protein